MAKIKKTIKVILQIYDPFERGNRIMSDMEWPIDRVGKGSDIYLPAPAVTTPLIEQTPDFPSYPEAPKKMRFIFDRFISDKEVIYQYCGYENGTAAKPKYPYLDRWETN